MAYLVPPQISAARQPTVNDDLASGFVVGSTFSDTSVTPPAVYVCLDDTVGAALWRRYGGVSQHSGLSNITWQLAGHDGSANSVAAFNASNVAAVYQPVTEGSVFTRNAGVFQWSSPPPPIITVEGRSTDILYLSASTTVGAGDELAVGQVIVFISATSTVTGAGDELVTGTVV